MSKKQKFEFSHMKDKSEYILSYNSTEIISQRYFNFKNVDVRKLFAPTWKYPHWQKATMNI